MSNFSFAQYQPTFNKAIDHCANLIASARHHNIPIEALCLSPFYFEWFKGGVKTLIEKQRPENWEELISNIDANDNSMQFDGVNIERSMFQTKPVTIKYYSTKPLDVMN